MTATSITAITGGIGTGKSIVSTVLRVMGFPVYDCDSRALSLINSDAALRCDITALLGRQAYDTNGRYDTAWVGARVFSDKILLARLNALVHPAVIADIKRWAQAQAAPRVFVETALLRQSGLTPEVDHIWRVVAPERTRIERVKARNGWDERDIAARIATQHPCETPFPGETTINNDGHEAVLPQIIAALRQ